MLHNSRHACCKNKHVNMNRNYMLQNSRHACCNKPHVNITGDTSDSDRSLLRSSSCSCNLLTSTCSTGMTVLAHQRRTSFAAGVDANPGVDIAVISFLSVPRYLHAAWSPVQHYTSKTLERWRIGNQGHCNRFHAEITVDAVPPNHVEGQEAER